MNIEPIEQYVVAEIIENELKKETSLLVIVEGAKGVTTEATVVAIGKGKTNSDGSIRPMSVAVGDKVLIPNDAGFPIKLENKKHAIVKEDDIIGILE